MTDKTCVIRLYEGSEYAWTDVSARLTYEEAVKKWFAITKQGSEKTTFNDIDYYAIWESGARLPSPK